MSNDSAISGCSSASMDKKRSDGCFSAREATTWNVKSENVTVSHVPLISNHPNTQCSCLEVCPKGEKGGKTATSRAQRLLPSLLFLVRPSTLVHTQPIAVGGQDDAMPQLLTSFMGLHTSAHGAQKLRTETLLRSFERSSLKCSGEVTVTRLRDV